MVKDIYKEKCAETNVQSGLTKGGVSVQQARIWIEEALDTLPSDVLFLVLRIVQGVESGLE